MAVGGLGVPDDVFIGTARQQLAALAHVTRLLSLDDLWTGYLEGAKKAPREDVGFDGLRGLAADMEAALELAVGAVPDVRATLDRLTDDSVVGALGIVLEAAPSLTDLIGWILRQGSSGTAPRQTLIGACDYIETEAGNELEILQGKARSLESRELPDPDLRPLFRCMGTLVGIGGVAALAAIGAVATIGVAPTIGLGVVAYGYSLSEAWDKSKCAEIRLPKKHKGKHFKF